MCRSIRRESIWSCTPVTAGLNVAPYDLHVRLLMHSENIQSRVLPAKVVILPSFVWFLFTVVVLIVLYLKYFNIYYFYYAPVFHIYSLLVSFYILSRFGIALLYKPPPYVGYLPTVTAIVSCKNEEDSIYDTVACIFASNYPRSRLEVIVVDDGSTDGTYSEMLRAKQTYPSLKILKFPRNLGKRHGMAAGALAAKHDILVYIDSDSFVEPFAIRKLVQSFSDPLVGGACGLARVKNATTNHLTKMQEVRYYVAFCVNKATESVFSAVSCCSGCLAAYRRAYVMPILNQWLHQRFLGSQATFGDDRSLTNYMLRRYKVVFDSEAVCSTIVPATARSFFKQQLRWKKSWIRETFIASGFMWRKHPIAALSHYINAVIPVISPFIVLRSIVIPVLSMCFPIFGTVPISTLYLIGCLLMVSLYGLYYFAYVQSRLWVYGFCSFAYSFVLIWLTYYALVTVRRNHWGTR